MILTLGCLESCLAFVFVIDAFTTPCALYYNEIIEAESSMHQ
jgi:hypothetical protein